MNLRYAILLSILAVTLLACAVLNPTPTMTDTRPNDFTIFYEWQEGSLPPPYHYEYNITIQPDGQGQVVMIPDYASSTVPTWTETFTVEQTEMDKLYKLMVDKELFTQEWRAQDQPPVGGSSESMTVTANGKQIEIPVYVIPELADAAAEMYAAVTTLVPETIWDKLNVQREQYVQEHSK
jgi:hypothetical protein